MTRAYALATALLGAAGLAVAGCGAGTAGRLRPAGAVASPVATSAVPASPAPAHVPELVAAVFRPLGATPGGTAFEVAWETGKCQIFHSIEVVESASTVDVTVRERVKPDSLCPDAGIQARRRVQLAAPLGARTIRNGGATPPLVLAS